MVAHNDTLNKLPLIGKFEPYGIWVFILLLNSLSLGRNQGDKSMHSLLTHYSEVIFLNFRSGLKSKVDKEKGNNIKTDPRFLFMQKLSADPTSSLTKKVLKDKYGLPISLESTVKYKIYFCEFFSFLLIRMKPYSSLKPLQRGKSTGKSISMLIQTELTP